MSISKNLAVLAEEAAERLGERKTMDFDGQSITNFQTRSRARRLQGAFADLGLAKGDTACLCMTNHPYVYAVFGGIFRTGATAVPVISQLAVAELRYIFEHTEGKGIVTDAQLVEKVRESIAGLDRVKWLAVLGGDDQPDASPPEYSLEALLEREEILELPEIAGDDIAMMLYTSGTTGRPKGVMLSHAILMAQAETVLDAAEMDHRPHPIISINALPMAHIFGVGVMNGGNVTPGKYPAGYVVQEARFEPERFMAKIVEHKATDMACVPTMLAMIMSHPNRKNYDLSSLVKVDIGAAPVPVDLARAFSEEYGCRIRQLYGMTENAGLATSDRISQPYRPGSAGLPYKDVSLRIVDDNDKEMPAGQSGEILTQGPTTMVGYFKQPETTAETIRGGWLYTGDIGYVDDDGWLFVIDRKKDMIIKGGENIFPAEVENVLYKHPGIAEAAVVGAPDEKFGEIIVAFVVAKGDEKLNEAELIEDVKTHITTFKAPSQVHIVKELPKSGVGKILRRVLRENAKELGEKRSA